LALSLAFAVCALVALVAVFRLQDRAVARTGPERPAPEVDE
jgi:hypothetical protein